MADTKRILVVDEQILQGMAETGGDCLRGCGVVRPGPIGEMGGSAALRALGS